MNKLSVTGKAQSDGAQTFSLLENEFTIHQLQIDVSAAPATGTMAIAIKTPGASVFSALDSTVDLTALSATNGKIIEIEAAAEAIKITPTSFEADKTYNAYLVSRK